MKNEKGITLIALAVSIIVIVIIASISISAGTQVLNQAKVQTVETNLLAIKAKAKAYAEEAEAASWALEDEAKKNEAKDNKLKENGLEFVNGARGKYYSTCKDALIQELQIDQFIADDYGQQFKYSLVAHKELSEIDCEVYYISNQGLVKIGLDENFKTNEDGQEVEEIEYLVIYDSSDFNNMDVIYIPGVSVNGYICYTLSELQSMHNQ